MLAAIGSNLHFRARQNVELDSIDRSIIQQLPFDGKFLNEATRVTDEGLSGDYLELSQNDSGNTKIICRFVDGKKVMQEVQYNGKIGHILLTLKDGIQRKVLKSGSDCCFVVDYDETDKEISRTKVEDSDNQFLEKYSKDFISGKVDFSA